MSMMTSLLGNAAEVDATTLAEEYEALLVPGETIDQAYSVFRDLFVFTNKRLLLVDKQGMTGKKVSYHSLPYKSITHFAVETAGTFDLDAELKIWLTGNPVPIQKQFNKKVNIYDVQNALAAAVL